MATYSMDGRTFNSKEELYAYQAQAYPQPTATEENWAEFDPEFAAKIGLSEEQWNQLVQQINAARTGQTAPIPVGPQGSHGTSFHVGPDTTPQELWESIRGLAYKTVNPDAYPDPVNTQRAFIENLARTSALLMGGAAAGGAFAGGGATGIASDGLTGVSTGGAQYLPGGQFPIQSVVAGSAEGLAQMPAWAGAGGALPAGEGMLTDFLGIGGGGGEVLSEVPLLPEGVGYMTPPAAATDALTGVTVPSAGKYINDALPYTAGPAASAFGTGPITSAAAGLAANAAAGAAQSAGGGGGGPTGGGGGGAGGIDWGQWLPQILSGVTGLYGYQQAQDNIAAAQQAQNDALMKGLDYARESRDMVFAQQEPFRQSSLGALRAMHSLTGLPVPDQLANPPQVMGGQMVAPAQQQASGTVQAGGPGGLVGMAPRQDLIGLARGGPTRGSAPYVVSEYNHPERVYKNGRMEIYRRPAMVAASRTGHVAPLRGRAVGGSLEPYGETSMQTLGGDYGATSAVTLGETPMGGSGYGDFNRDMYSANAQGQVPTNPGGQPGGYNFMTDPGYQFRINEGMRALENSAAARGGLLSGGFGKQALRYATDYSAQEYTNVYNRIANIAGLNQVSGPLQANAASQYGATAPNIAAAQGANAASGYTAQNNASASMLNQIATAFGDIDWDSIFGNKK
jgi:hypothetical protein